MNMISGGINFVILSKSPSVPYFYTAFMGVHPPKSIMHIAYSPLVPQHLYISRFGICSIRWDV